MIVEVIKEGYCNTYFVGTEKEFIIIDPSIDIRSIEFTIKKRFPNALLKGIYLTHGHYDHICTLPLINKKYNVPVYVHKNDLAKVNDINLSCATYFGITHIDEISNLQKVPVLTSYETFSIKVIHTPGHTNGSVCYLIENNLFSGDTLFNNAVGRTDLLTSSEKSLNESIISLMKLDPSLVVYPGHGRSSTILDEKENNYYYKMIK